MKKTIILMLMLATVSMIAQNQKAPIAKATGDVVFLEDFQGYANQDAAFAGAAENAWTYLNLGGLSANANQHLTWGSGVLTITGGSNCIRQQFGGADPDNKWAISPGFSLVSGQVYTVFFDFAMLNAGVLNVAMGDAVDSAAATGMTTFKTLNEATSSAWVLQKATYTAARTGIHYLGFQFASPQDVSARIGFDNIIVIEGDVELANAAVTAVTTSTIDTNYVATETEISVTIRNLGSAPITSIPLSYKVGEAAAVNQTFSCNITPTTDSTFTFTTKANLSAIGVHNIMAYSSLANDAVVANDTLRVTRTTSVEAGILLESPRSASLAPFTAEEEITVAIRNNGTLPISNVSVTLLVNEDAPVTEVIAGPIRPSENFLYTFNATANLFAIGDHTITLWIDSVANDENRANDTVTAIVTTQAGVVFSETFEGFANNQVDVFNVWTREMAPGNSAWGFSTLTGFAPVDRSPRFLSHSRTSLPTEDSWVISPAIALEAGKEYTITFDLALPVNRQAPWQLNMDPEDPFVVWTTSTLSVYMGSAAAMSAMDEYLETYVDLYEEDPTPEVALGVATYVKRTIMFTPDETRDYFIGFQIMTPAYFGDYVFLDNIFVTEQVPDYDAAVVAITAPVGGSSAEFTAGEDVTVTVRNNGLETLENVSVSFRVGNQTAVTEAIAGPLAWREEASYTFTGKADLSAVGAHTVAAFVSLANDEDLSNDTLRINVTTTGGASIETTEDTRTTVYPNPVTDRIIVDGASVKRAEIYNIQGQLLKVILNNANEIPVADLNHGVYVLKITTDAGVSTHRFVKE